MYGLSTEEWQDLVLSVNVHRKQRRLSPYQAACNLEQALKHSTVEELANSLGFTDTTTLRNIHRLHKLPIDLASLVHWGTRRGSLSMSTAAELMRLDSETDVREAFRAAIEHNFTRDEARQVVQIRKRSGNSIGECVRQAWNTRPRIERSVLVLGSFVTELSQLSLDDIGDETAARLLGMELAREIPQVVAKALRISNGRFSLLLSEEDALELRASLGSLSIENYLSELLERATKR